MKKLLLLLATICTLTSCAVVERENAPVGGDKPAPGKALCVFYRPSRYFGSLRGVQISDHDKPVGDLGNGTYFVYQAAPGEHLFNGNGDKDEATPIRLDAGKTYYFRCTIEAGAWLPHYAVVNVPSQSGVPPHLKRVRWLGR